MLRSAILGTAGWALACASGSLAPLPSLPSSPAPLGPAIDVARIELAVYLPAADPSAADAWRGAIAQGWPELRVVADRPGPDDRGVAVLRPPIDAYGPLPADALRHFARGLADGEVERAALAADVVVTAWQVGPADARRALALAEDTALAVARARGGWVWDQHSRLVYAPDAFEQERAVGGWKDGVPLAERRISVHAYDNGGWMRVVTVGAQQLGLPDLVVDGALARSRGAVARVTNALAQGLVQGMPVQPDGRIRVALSDLADPTSADLVANGGSAVVEVGLRVAEPQEGDAENRLWSIDFGETSAEDRYAAQERALDAIFGPRFEEEWIERAPTDDAALARAAEQARLELVELRAAGALDEVGATLQVKGPFATVSGGTEWMWVEVHEWDGGEVLRGALVNVPEDVPALKLGSMVEVRRKQVADYVLERPDGSTRGNLSAPILERR